MLHLIVALMAAPVPYEGPWAEYQNDRFGYSACYPSDLMQPKAEKGRDDGVRFKSKDGTELIVWVREDLAGKGLYGEVDLLEQEMAKAGGRFVHQTTGGGIRTPWTIAEVYFSGKERYQVTIKRGGDLLSMRFSVPLRLKENYEPMVDHLTSCFRVKAAAPTVSPATQP